MESLRLEKTSEIVEPNCKASAAKSKTREGFGCCGQWLLVTNGNLFVLLILILEGGNVVAGGFF